MDMKVMVGKGTEAYGSTSLGSTSIPVGARVRAVGIKVCIVAMGTVERIS